MALWKNSAGNRKTITNIVRVENEERKYGLVLSFFQRHGHLEFCTGTSLRILEVSALFFWQRGILNRLTRKSRFVFRIASCNEFDESKLQSDHHRADSPQRVPANLEHVTSGNERRLPVEMPANINCYSCEWYYSVTIYVCTAILCVAYRKSGFIIQ